MTDTTPQPLDPPAPPPDGPLAAPAPHAVARWEGPVAGLVALTTGLAAAGLVAAIAGVDGPFVSVGDRVVDAAPRWLKQLSIELFGTNDKRALLVGVGLVLAALAVAAGRAARHRRGTALAAVGVVGLVGALAAATRTGSEGGDWVPPLVGAAVAAAVLARLSPRPARAEAPVFESPLTSDRRRFLVQAGAFGVGAGALAGAARLVRDRETTSIRAATADRTLPPARSAAAPVGPGATATGGLEPYLTPNANFYRIDTALSIPNVDPDTWKLTIGGMVDRPLTLTYDELLARPMVERIVTLTCVSNEVGGDLVGNARWLGVPLKDLLTEAGVKAGATQVASESVDGWTCGFPTAVALDGRDALVAVGMNGEPLPRRSGYPARLVVPGLYGYVSATKWLKEIRLTTWEAFDGYWVPRGWSKEGPIKTASRIDVPRVNDNPPAGRVVVAGVAWAQHRGISRVELEIDGTWVDAEMAEQPTVDGWRQWRYEWDAPAGRHTLRVRATDGTGAVQSGETVDVAPNGAEGYHRRRVDIG